MTGRLEHADGERNGPFPSSWGAPRGEPGSEQRAGWVAGRVRQLVLQRKQGAEQRAAYLARKRRTPW